MPQTGRPISHSRFFAGGRDEFAAKVRRPGRYLKRTVGRGCPRCATRTPPGMIRSRADRFGNVQFFVRFRPLPIRSRQTVFSHSNGTRVNGPGGNWFSRPGSTGPPPCETDRVIRSSGFPKRVPARGEERLPFDLRATSINYAVHSVH